MASIFVQMSAEKRPSFSDIVSQLEAMSKEEDEEKPAALGKTRLEFYDNLSLRSFF